MSWIFITVILTVVTGGCSSDTSVGDHWQVSSVNPTDAAAIVCNAPTKISNTQPLLTLQCWSIDFPDYYTKIAQPDFYLLPRSQIFRDHFSGTSPPVV